MTSEVNIVLAGVGGQGTLVAGKLLGQAAILQGLDVKVSEVHGMAQRGGSVITYVRMGEKVFSPVIEAGTADYILAFEELEAMRWLGLLRRGGVLLVNRQQIQPVTVATGQAEYPPRIPDELKQRLDGRGTVHSLDARGLAEQAGSTRAVNVVMAGALSVFLGWNDAMIEQSIDQVFPEKYRRLNHAAFKAGSDIIKSILTQALS